MPNILLAEDDDTSALIASHALASAGHSVSRAASGLEAEKLLQEGNFDAVVTDWMMPEMDGLDLIRRIHARFEPIPATIMLTSLSLAQARAHALESGADEFVAKPMHAQELVVAVERALARRSPGSMPVRMPTIPRSTAAPAAPFPLVVVGANAGGPSALRMLLRRCGPSASHAAWIVAQHGLPELVLGLMPLLSRETSMRVVLATHGTPIVPGRVILAPGGSHVRVSDDGRCIELLQDRDIHHVRPAADPLFRSAAAAAGRRCIAVVLTGMGRDGTEGAAFVKAAGGRVLVAEPGPHVARGMADSVIRAGFATDVVPLESLGATLTQAVDAADAHAPAPAIRAAV